MRRVLVTGGGSGIGRAIAWDFAAAGDAVTITGRRADALEETDGGRGMTCIAADISDEQAIKTLFTDPFDVVVANAGMGQAMKLVDTPLDLWNQTLTVNLTGVFLTFREALKTMGPGGRLIAIASIASLQGGPNLSAYTASKHGVLGLVRSLAYEVAKQGITCNAVCPGFVDTDMAEGAVQNVMNRFGLDHNAAVAQITSRNPMRRMIEPNEVVAAVRFLASADASMVNGHAMSVSGGEI